WPAGSVTPIELGNIGTTSQGITNADANFVSDNNNTAGSATKFGSGGSNLGRRSVRWLGTGTSATELGSLGTDSSGVTTSEAFGVDNAGTAVGYAQKFVGGVLKG